MITSSTTWTYYDHRRFIDVQRERLIRKLNDNGFRCIYAIMSNIDGVQFWKPGDGWETNGKPHFVRYTIPMDELELLIATIKMTT